MAVRPKDGVRTAGDRRGEIAVSLAKSGDFLAIYDFLKTRMKGHFGQIWKVYSAVVFILTFCVILSHNAQCILICGDSIIKADWYCHDGTCTCS